MKFGGYAKEHASILAFLLRIQDWIVVLLSGYLSFILLEPYKIIPYYEGLLPDKYLFAIVVAYLLSAWWFPVFCAYRTWRGESLLEEIRSVLSSWSVVFLGLFAIIIFAKISTELSRTWLLSWYAAGAVGLVLSRVMLRLGLGQLREKGLNQRHIILVGSGELGQRVALKIKRTTWTGLHIVGFFSDTAGQHQFCNEIAAIPDLGKLDEVVDFVDKHDIDQVWITMSLRHLDKIKRLIDDLHTVAVDVRLIPDIFSLRLLNHSISQIDGIPVINMSVTPMVGANRLAKWVEDKLLASLILCVISPVMLIIALIVKINSSGPVFYKQERVSWNGRKFMMLKFRSMPVGVDNAEGAPVWGRAAEKKPTKVGQLLRKTSLDELPQFINVLKGDMSIVGPRPERQVFVDQFKKDIPNYMQKHLVKAGITGWAQVNGWRGDTSLNKRIEYDLWYIEHWSLWLDLKIILWTVFKGFLHENAY